MSVTSQAACPAPQGLDGKSIVVIHGFGKEICLENLPKTPLGTNSLHHSEELEKAVFVNYVQSRNSPN